MSTTSEEDTTDAMQSNFMTEASLENLKACRSAMLDKYNDFMELTRQFEIADLKKYLPLSNLRQTTCFESDSEDMGIEEDLILLQIVK